MRSALLALSLLTLCHCHGGSVRGGDPLDASVTEPTANGDAETLTVKPDAAPPAYNIELLLEP